MLKLRTKIYPAAVVAPINVSIRYIVRSLNLNHPFSKVKIQLLNTI